MIPNRPDQFAMRLPDGLRDRIKQAATRNHRSMNSEIVFHLERIFAPQAATGEESPNHAPAAVTRTDALQGVNSVNQGY